MDQELAALRKTASAIVGAKRKGEDQQIGRLATEGLLQILKIKEANKRLCVRVEAAKEETSSCKLSLENSDSTLQNLLYEKNYYEKEIHTCRSFVSKVKDEAVALMPVEQFFASLGTTPEDDALRAKANSSAHELMKARLVHENALRKSLVEQLAGLKQEKQSTQDAVNMQAKLLNELQTRLKGVESTAKPLQTVLGPTVHLKGSVSRASEVLPTPLYIVYSQLIAAGEALQMGCSVSILGSTEEAESFARSLVTDTSTVDDSHPNSPHYQPASLEDLYKPHPLSVELHVHREASPSPTVIKPPTILMSVILQYLPALKVVTAHCKDPADNVVLKSLFPADDGSGMPIEALQQLQAGTFKFSSSRVPRPYRWCQLLAGLDFVPTLPQLAVQLQPGEQLDTVLTGLDTYRKQQRVPAVVARLRQVKIGEAALNSLITFKAMMHNYIPADITMYSGVRPTSVVLSWEQIATVTAAALPDTPAPRPSRAPTHIGAARQSVPPALAQAFAAAEEEGALDDGELPQGLEQQQQPLSNGSAGAAAAGEADGDQEPASEGGGAMAWEGRDQQRDEEEEEGALPDEAQDDTTMQDQQAPDTSTRERSGRSRMKSDAALKLLLLEVNEEEAVAEPVVRQARPVSRRYRLVARSNVLELEASVWVFSEYPIRAPLFRVRALRQLPAASADAIAAAREKGLNKDPVKSLPAVLTSVPAGEALGPVASANHVAWLEQQVNVAALGLVPKARSNDTLCYQVFHLRLALDAVTRAYELGSTGGCSSQAVPGATRNLPVTVPGVQRQVEDLAVLHFRQQLVGRDRQPPPLGHI